MRIAAISDMHSNAVAFEAVLDIERQTLGTQIRRVAYDVEAVVQIAHARSMPDVDLFERAVRHAEFPYHPPTHG